MAGFEYVPDGGVDTEVLRTYQLAASQTVYPGDAVKFSNGHVTPVSGQTDVAIGVISQVTGRPGDNPTIPTIPEITTLSPLPITSGATVQLFVKVVLAYGGLTRFRIGFTPLVNDLDAESNSTITQSKVALTDGSSSDLVGGLVYCPELDEARIITANTYSSNVVTLTHLAFSRIVTTGDTLRVVAFGPGDAAVKFGSSNPQRTIATAIADVASGKLTIHEVDMKLKRALVSFNAA